MAATILTVGFMGLIQAVTISSGMMDAARRQTLAAQILTHEIERLRLLPWQDLVASDGSNDIAGLAANPSYQPDTQFDTARAAVGDNQTANASVKFTVGLSVATITTGLREATITVTWVVTTSRRDGSGNPLKFTYTRVNSAYLGKNGLNLTYQRS